MSGEELPTEAKLVAKDQFDEILGASMATGKNSVLEVEHMVIDKIKELGMSRETSVAITHIETAFLWVRRHVENIA